MANSSAVRIFATGSAKSTQTTDTNAVQATGNELQTALHLFESEAAAFAKSVIRDPAARLEYNKRTKAAVSELIELVRQRKVTPHEAARSANAMRNQVMVLARSRLSDFGLAVSREMKANGRTLAELEEAYARKRFGRMFATLTEAVATADDQVREAAKEGTGIAAGGAVGTITLLALASNPAGWAVGLTMIVGAAIGAAGSSELFDYFWPEK